jgi:hypothetical protein
MAKNGQPVQPYRLGMITRELEAMCDWELERGSASSLGFDLDRRTVADRILRKRYAKAEHGGVAFWTLVASTIAIGVGILFAS